MMHIQLAFLFFPSLPGFHLHKYVLKYANQKLTKCKWNFSIGNRKKCNGRCRRGIFLQMWSQFLSVCRRESLRKYYRWHIRREFQNHSNSDLCSCRNLLMLFIGSTIDIGGIFGSSEYVNISAYYISWKTFSLIWSEMFYTVL